MITTQSTPVSSPVLLRLRPEQGHRHHPGPETFLIFLFLSLLNRLKPHVTFTQGAASSWSSAPHSCSSFSTSWASRWRRWRWRRRRRWWRRGVERGEKGIDSLLLLGGAASTSPASAQKRVYSSLQRGLCSSQVTHIRNRNDKIRSAPPCSHPYETAFSLAGT